ncbi:MAG TPA: hypothetical protein VFE30_12605 [Anaeromyxobacteraceae bacterium]|jgi:hypothetical protein|nr:hypothetical protein [Anaeromyxobacteraceae bacterium]
MPVPLLVIAALGAGLLAVAVAVWPKILSWSEETLFPWFHQHLPQYEGFVRQAFANLDKVAVAVRRVAKQAWGKLREHILKLSCELQRNSQNETVRRVTAWIEKTLATGERKVAKVVTEQEVSFEDLPDDVRQEFIRHGAAVHTVDVKKARDQELLQLEA